MSTLPDFKEIRDDTFTQEVINAPGLVFLEFYRDSCSSCRVFETTLNSVSEKYRGQFKFVRLNTDKGGMLHYNRLGIQGDPTVCIFYKGQMEGRLIGASPLQYFLPMLQDILVDMGKRLQIQVPPMRM